MNITGQTYRKSLDGGLIENGSHYGGRRGKLVPYDNNLWPYKYGVNPLFALMTRRKMGTKKRYLFNRYLDRGKRRAGN